MVYLPFSSKLKTAVKTPDTHLPHLHPPTPLLQVSEIFLRISSPFRGPVGCAGSVTFERMGSNAKFFARLVSLWNVK